MNTREDLVRLNMLMTLARQLSAQDPGHFSTDTFLSGCQQRQEGHYQRQRPSPAHDTLQVRKVSQLVYPQVILALLGSLWSQL